MTDKVDAVLDVLAEVFSFGSKLAGAFRKKDWKRVEELMKDPLAVSAALRRAERYAEEISKTPGTR